MSENTKIATIVILGILLLTSIIVTGTYIHYKLKVSNFQITINELSEEQKCMHICGFQYPTATYFDQYKFCLEKCDRISERQSKCTE